MGTPVTEAKVLQHAVLHRSGQVCFSKTMLPECAIGFMASETLVKEAGFVCLPAAAPETKDILRRVHLGQECTIDNHASHLHHKGPRGQGVQASVTIKLLEPVSMSITSCNNIQP